MISLLFFNTLFAVRLYILAFFLLNFSRSVSDNHLNLFFGKMYHYIQKSGRDTRPLLINFTRKLLQLTLRQKILLSSKPQMEKKVLIQSYIWNAYLDTASEE